MLIAGAAALLVGLGGAMIRRFADAGAQVSSDPIRVIGAVVTAVGFLGAGMIIRRSDTEDLAVGVTALDVATLRGVGILEERLRERRSRRRPPA